MALAALTSVIWAPAFVAGKLALDGFSAPQLTSLRFAIAALPVLFLPRPAISWPAPALRSVGMGPIVAGVAIAVMPPRSRPRAST